MLTNNNNDDFEFLDNIDKLMSSIYKDKKYYFLSYKEIAELRCMNARNVKALFIKAKRLLKDKNGAWMDGLSVRAIHTIEHKYKNYIQLYNDVMVEGVDLELLDGAGHEVAVEIRRWVMKHESINPHV